MIKKYVFVSAILISSTFISRHDILDHAIANFGLNLAGAGNRPTRITLKAQPTIMVGSQSVAYPGYLTIQNEFISN